LLGGCGTGLSQGGRKGRNGEETKPKSDGGKGVRPLTYQGGKRGENAHIIAKTKVPGPSKNRKGERKRKGKESTGRKN